MANEIKGQAFPDVQHLLSVKDKQAVKDFESAAAIVYISEKGHRQWPSVAESTMLFIAKCVGRAREEFIRQMAVLRLRQKSVKQEDEDALREAAREASRRKARGEEPDEPVTLADTLAKDPRSDRFLMDQLVDTGSRTVEGMAAMNGEVIRRMGEQNPGKGPLLPFETAYQNLKEVMEGLRAKQDAEFNHEKSMVKLKDNFSAFKDKKGNPHEEEEDDGVDFGDWYLAICHA